MIVVGLRKYYDVRVMRVERKDGKVELVDYQIRTSVLVLTTGPRHLIVAQTVASVRQSMTDLRALFQSSLHVALDNLAIFHEKCMTKPSFIVANIFRLQRRVSKFLSYFFKIPYLQRLDNNDSCLRSII